MDNVLSPLQSLEEYKYLIQSLREKTKTIEVHGISDAQKSMMAALVSKAFDRSVLVITHNDILARKIYEDVSFFDQDAAVLLPTAEMIFHKIDARSNEIAINRLKALNKLGKGERVVLCASVEALLNKMPEPDYFYSKFEYILNSSIGGNSSIFSSPKYFRNSSVVPYKIGLPGA